VLAEKSTASAHIAGTMVEKYLGDVNSVHVFCKRREQTFLAGANWDCANPAVNFHKFTALQSNLTRALGLVLILLKRLKTTQIDYRIVLCFHLSIW
jgi:hypothetical protein